MSEDLLFVHGIPAQDVEEAQGPALPVRTFFDLDLSARFYAAMELTRLRARNTVAVALREGRIRKPEACEECGARGRLESHHEDYARPLDVRWYCLRCHRQRTRQIMDLAREDLGTVRGRPAWLRVRDGTSGTTSPTFYGNAGDQGSNHDFNAGRTPQDGIVRYAKSRDRREWWAPDA